MFDPRGKDLLRTPDWPRGALDRVIELAREMKANRWHPRYMDLLKGKTMLMLFYSESSRTRQSFEAAMTELGGHAQFLEPQKMRIQTKTYRGEVVKDTAGVMSRYGQVIGVRIAEDKLDRYGEGYALIKEYADHATVPVINMCDDTYHPCQALADLMTLQEAFGQKEFHGKKFLHVWGYSPTKARSWCSVQESLLLQARYGWDITLAYPPGFDLDPAIVEQAQVFAAEAGGRFEITHDLQEAYRGAHVVYSRNWMSPRRYEIGMEAELKSYEPYRHWCTTSELMALTENAYFVHPMPVERGFEVTDEVADSDRSLIYEQAENRLHVQKAILALVLGALT